MVRGRPWGVSKWAKMAKKYVSLADRENGQKKMKKNSLVDVIFVGSQVGTSTMVVHDEKK